MTTPYSMDSRTLEFSKALRNDWIKVRVPHARALLLGRDDGLTRPLLRGGVEVTVVPDSSSGTDMTGLTNGLSSFERERLHSASVDVLGGDHFEAVVIPHQPPGITLENQIGMALELADEDAPIIISVKLGEPSLEGSLTSSHLTRQSDVLPIEIADSRLVSSRRFGTFFWLVELRRGPTSSVFYESLERALVTATEVLADEVGAWHEAWSTQQEKTEEAESRLNLAETKAETLQSELGRVRSELAESIVRARDQQQEQDKKLADLRQQFEKQLADERTRLQEVFEWRTRELTDSENLNPSTDLCPFGYRRVVDGRFGVVGSVVGGRPGVDEVLRLVEELADLGGVDIFGLTQKVSLPEGVRVFGESFETGLVDRLRGYAGVVDHPAVHDSTEKRAELLVGLAAAGVPTVALEIDQSLGTLLGDDLAHVLTSASIEDLRDPEPRDRLSVRLRRIGLSSGSQVTRWREIAGALDLSVEPLPKVSVVLTTNRPDFLAHAMTQVRNQTYPSTELVLVLHGDEFTQTDKQLEDLYQSPLTVERVDSSKVFGEAINRGVAASTGTLIAKMDDDDWYSPHHLWDLVRAMDYSGADLVGKAAEFVYLEELDITIRRMVNGSETYGNRNLGGGTFLIKRSTLNTIGGWRRVPRHVDQALLDDMEMLSYPWYRTFGHGYLLNRRSAGHTWDTSIDYFLEHSESQWRGFADDEALIADESVS